MEIHHAIPRAVFESKYPTLITEEQLHSLENLRGIPYNATMPNGSKLHTHITNLWNNFYNTHPQATTNLQNIIDFVKTIDDQFGNRFIPPIR